MHGVEIVTFMPEFSLVAVFKRNLHLREEYLFECRAQILGHIGRVCKLVQTTLAIRLSSTASDLHAILGACFGDRFQIRLVALPAKHCGHTFQEQRVA